MPLVVGSNTPYQGALQLHKIPQPLVPIPALLLDELDNGMGERLARPTTRENDVHSSKSSLSPLMWIFVHLQSMR